MNSEHPNLVPLQHASLCLDCDVISASRTNCLACGSRALMSIARTLGWLDYAAFPSTRGVIRPGAPGRAGDFLHST